MSFDPYVYEAEEARAAERFYTGPDDPDRPDPSEYEELSDCFHLFKLLDCGHNVAASEDSGGMDELDRVTPADVRRLLDFKIVTHNCERFETAVKVRAEGRPFG